MSPILAPVIALVLWSFVMLFWLYAERIVAVKKQGILYDPRRPAEEFHAQLPAQARWKADNYNHLMDQRTSAMTGARIEVNALSPVGGADVREGC